MGVIPAADEPETGTLSTSWPLQVALDVSKRLIRDVQGRRADSDFSCARASVEVHALKLPCGKAHGTGRGGAQGLAVRTPFLRRRHVLQPFDRPGTPTIVTRTARLMADGVSGDTAVPYRCACGVELIEMGARRGGQGRTLGRGRAILCGQARIEPCSERHAHLQQGLTLTARLPADTWDTRRLL